MGSLSDESKDDDRCKVMLGAGIKDPPGDVRSRGENPLRDQGPPRDKGTRRC